MPRSLLSALGAALALVACADASYAPTAPDIVRQAVVSPDERITASARWNQRTREIVGRRGGGSNGAARTFAMVSVAQHNAVVAAEDAKSRGVHPSEAGAVAGASAALLLARYPDEATFIATSLTADAAFYPSLPTERDADFAAGVEVGRAVGAAVFAYAETDGSKTPWDGFLPAGDDVWTPISLPPQDATWGGVRPWLMSSGDQFHPLPPPARTSQEFQADLAEVLSYTSNLTDEQRRIAQYWASGYGPGGPAGFFGSVAAGLATARHLDERRAARLLAVMHMAIMDASIGCYEAKYVYWYLRPYEANPAITTAVTRPNFPSYPSAHSCLSAAAVGVLAKFFPSEADALRAMVEEAGMSRIYAGLHFRFDVTAGQALGFAVAELALRLAPNGHQAIPLD